MINLPDKKFLDDGPRLVVVDKIYKKPKSNYPRKKKHGGDITKLTLL